MKKKVISREKGSDAGNACGICLNAYDSSEHKKQFLPCFHHLCHVCYRQITKDGRIQCPFDRNIFSEPEPDPAPPFENPIEFEEEDVKDGWAAPGNPPLRRPELQQNSDSENDSEEADPELVAWQGEFPYGQDWILEASQQPDINIGQGSLRQGYGLEERSVRIAQEAAERNARITRQAAERNARITRQAAERNARITRQAAERNARITRETAERNARITREAAERNARITRETAERNARITRETAERNARIARETAERQLRIAQQTERRNANRVQAAGGKNDNCIII